MKKLLLLCWLLCIMLAAGAQQRRYINEKVALARSAGQTFEPVNLLQEQTRVSELNRSLATVVNRYTLFNYDADRAGRIARVKPEALTLTIQSGKEGIIEVELVKADIMAPDFKAINADRPNAVLEAPEAAYYHGVVKGIETSLAAISISNDEIAGFVSIAGRGNFVLGRIKDGSSTPTHIFYNENDMPAGRGYECRTRDDLGMLPPSITNNNNSTALVNNPMNCTRIYVECDYQVVITTGSVAAANAYCVNLFNQGAALYENEFVHVVLSSVFILGSGQNGIYTSSASGNLSTFQSLRAATFPGDLAIVVTTKGAPSSANGIAAGFAGLCNTTRANSMASMAAAGAVSAVPTYSRTAKVFTHELGHLFGSRHTHACVWNPPANNTAIDGCAGFTEGGCAVPPIPAAGTIMSYCDTYGTAPIDFTLGFGPQPGNLIRNNAHNAACLANCTPSIDLWSQDMTTDVGNEPNSAGGAVSNSPDIWVRNINDGLVNQWHQNPEFGQVNYLYVRVRNKGSLPSVAMSNVRLYTYWAKANSALSWTYPWQGGGAPACVSFPMGSPIGNAGIPSVPAGGSIIMIFPWSPPNPANYACFGSDQSHFCLLSRIQTTNYSPFGMAFPETTNLPLNVRNNNNIAWKNISIVNNLLDFKPVKTAVLVGGYEFHQIPTASHGLRFTVPEREQQDPLHRHARVIIDLGKFTDRWIAGGARGQGIRLVDGGQYGPRVELMGPFAAIDNLAIADNEINNVVVELTKTDPAAKGNYNLQMDLTSDGGEVIGGETFEARFDEFTAQANGAAADVKTPEANFTAQADKGVLTVRVSDNKQYTLELSDANGKPLAAKRFNNQTQVPVSKYAPGTYIVKLTPVGGGNNKIKRVIIN